MKVNKFMTIAYVIEDDKIMETSFKDVLKKIQEREQKRSLHGLRRIVLIYIRRLLQM